MMNKFKNMPWSVLLAVAFLAILLIIGMIWLPWVVIPFVILIAVAASIGRIAHWLQFER